MFGIKMLQNFKSFVANFQKNLLKCDNVINNFKRQFCNFLLSLNNNNIYNANLMIVT